MAPKVASFPNFFNAHSKADLPSSFVWNRRPMSCGSRYPSATYFRDRLLRGRTLHHPHMLKDFERKYPSATYFRDRLLKGRTSS
jgi:hypothetical protein